MIQTENINLPILQEGDKYSKDIQNQAFRDIDREIKGLNDRVKILDNVEGSIIETKEDVEALKINKADTITTNNKFEQTNQQINKINEQLEHMTTYVTPEMYGAVGDGVTDDTTSIQNAIDTNKKVVMKNNYKFSSITLKNDLESIGVLNGNIIINKSNINLNFKEINGSVIILSDGVLVQHCNIKGNRLTNNKSNALILKADSSSGVQYNNIEIGLISSSNNCIYLEKIKGWVNNNYVKNTGFTGNCGIGSLTQNDKYDGMTFDNVGFEHINKWFELNNCYNFIFRDFRMMPFEAHSEETYLGIMNNSNCFFETSITGFYFQKVNCTNSYFECQLAMSNEGEMIAETLYSRDNIVHTVTRSNRPQYFKKLSEMNGIEVLNYRYDYTKPIYINCDTSKYVWFNIQIPLVISGINYFKLHLIGEPQKNIEVAINNVLKLTIQPSNFKEEYIIFI